MHPASVGRGAVRARACRRTAPTCARCRTWPAWPRWSTTSAGPPGSRCTRAPKWLMASLGLLVLNLLHSTTHSMAGMAQIVFQLSIVAPVFWMTRAVRSEARLDAHAVDRSSRRARSARWWACCRSTTPSTFLPPEFSALGLRDEPGARQLADLSRRRRAGNRPAAGPERHAGRRGRGGHADDGARAWCWRSASETLGRRARACCLAAAADRHDGAAADAGAVAGARRGGQRGRVRGAAAAPGPRPGRARRAWSSARRWWRAPTSGRWRSAATRWSTGSAASSTTASCSTFQEERGAFLTYTLSELLFEYPLGAGIGRWGMMHVYFGDASMWEAPPIHVEIQPTGWLLDGGVPLWVAMGGAIAAGLRASYLRGGACRRLDAGVGHGDPVPADRAADDVSDRARVQHAARHPVLGASPAALWGPLFGAEERLARREALLAMREGRLRRFVAGLGLGYLHTAAALVVGVFLTPYLLRASRRARLRPVAPCRAGAGVSGAGRRRRGGAGAARARVCRRPGARRGFRPRCGRLVGRDAASGLRGRCPASAVVAAATWWLLPVRVVAAARSAGRRLRRVRRRCFRCVCSRRSCKACRTWASWASRSSAGLLAGTLVTLGAVWARAGALRAGARVDHGRRWCPPFWRGAACARATPSSGPRRRARPAWDHVRAQFSRGMWISVSQIAQVLLTGTDLLVVGALLGSRSRRGLRLHREADRAARQPAAALPADGAAGAQRDAGRRGARAAGSGVAQHDAAAAAWRAAASSPWCSWSTSGS